MDTPQHATNICTLFAEPSHRTAITGPVDLIRDAHRRVTGRDLSVRDAIHRLHVYGDEMRVGGDLPTPTWKPRLVSHLCEATYTTEAILLVLAYCDRYATARRCPSLHADDTDAVEAILPGRPVGNRAHAGPPGEPVAP